MTSSTSQEGEKQRLLEEICAVAGLRPMRNSRGSSTPSKMVRALAERYGVHYDSMPATAKRISVAAGVPWDSRTCDSRLTESGGGSTVQVEGLERLLKAVRRVESRAGSSGHPSRTAASPRR